MKILSYRDELDAIRSRRSYRLLVLSWRVASLAAASGALAQILWTSHLMSRTVLIALIVPIGLVFCVSVFVVIGASAIQVAYFSSSPLGGGPIQRQVRFSRMLFVDIVTLPWSLTKRSDR